MRRSESSTFGIILAISAAALFGTLGPVSRIAYDIGIEPLPFVSWRGAIGLLVIAAIVVGRGTGRRSIDAFRTLGRGSIGFLIIAALAGLLLNLGMFVAFDRIPIALALLLFYVYPAMVAVTAVAFGFERASRATAVALAFALAGMALVVLGGSASGDGGHTAELLGIGLALGAAAAQTVFVTVSRSGYRTLPTDAATVVILAGVAAGAIAISAAVDGVAALAFPIGTPEVLPALIIAGALGAGIPSFLFLTSIRMIGGTRAGIAMLFEPVVGVGLAAVLLHEGVGPIQVAGGVLILLAAIIVQRRPAPPGHRALAEDALAAGIVIGAAHEVADASDPSDPVGRPA